MWHADSADDRAGPRDREGGLGRLGRADTLEDRIGADIVRQLMERVDCFVTADVDDVGSAPLASEQMAVLVRAGEQDDPCCAVQSGGEHAAQANSTVADDRDGGALFDAGANGGVVAGCHHIGAGEQ